MILIVLRTGGVDWIDERGHSTTLHDSQDGNSKLCTVGQGYANKLTLGQAFAGLEGSCKALNSLHQVFVTPFLPS